MGVPDHVEERDGGRPAHADGGAGASGSGIWGCLDAMPRA